MKSLMRLVICMMLLSGLASRATLTPLRFYHLGEDDPGVGQGVIATNSLDSVSTNAITFTGSPAYWAYAAPDNTNSTYCILVSEGDEGTAAVVTNDNNVCLEAWADTGWRTSHVVAYDGDSTTNGYGFILTNNNYLAVLGGVGVAATIPCPPGAWIHLALVCSNGVVAVFTNGTLAALTNATPLPPTGNLFIGGPNVGNTEGSDLGTPLPVYPADLIHGFVDDVRISTFAPGGFKPADLLYVPALQLPLAIALSGTNVVISAPANKTFATLQSTADLGSPDWEPVDATEVLALQQVRTNSISGDSLYFRFDPSAGSPVTALLIDGTLFQLQDSPSSVDIPDALTGNPYLVYTIPSTVINARFPHSFDASHCVDPLTDATNTLSYHWIIFESEANGGLIYHGMPDYHSSVFPIPVQSMPALQDPTDGADPDALYWQARLEVHHIPYTPGVEPSQETIFWFRFQYSQSIVDITTEAALFTGFPDVP